LTRVKPGTSPAGEVRGTVKSFRIEAIVAAERPAIASPLTAARRHAHRRR
jgi:hypothetical protein